MNGLTSASADERFTAARALAGRPGAALVLGAALADEKNGRVREAMFMSLVRTGGSAAVEVLLPCLRSEDAALRTGAIEALCAMPAEAASYISLLLADPDPDVRLLSCEVARQLPPAEDTKMLCDLLDGETEANVCAAAAEVLAEVGEPTAEAALIRCAERFPDEDFLRFALRTALARLARG